MKEILTIHIGQCGNMIATKFWEKICLEHQINPAGYFDGTDTLELLGLLTHFNETAHGQKFVPRAILLDGDPMTLDSCRCSPYGQIFRPDNFIFGRSGAENNFGKAYNSAESKDLVDYTLETLRREAEYCESLSGFNITHAIGGGCGSGLGSHLMERLADEYSRKILTAFTVFPADKVSESVVETYNTVLAIPALLKHCHMDVVFDNEALYSICQNVLKLNRPTYEDANELIAGVLSGMSSPSRFAGTSNMSLRKQNYLLVPYPDAHFFLPGFAPLNSRGVQAYRTFSVEDIVQQIFSHKTLMSSVDPRLGKFITTEIVLRGQFSEFILEDSMIQFQKANKSSFVPWLDNHCSFGVCSIPPVGMKISATYLANHTCITRAWRKIQQSFRKMYEKKAFVQWYCEEGMVEKDFLDADEEFTKLIEKYEFLEVLPGSGGCVTELGDEDISCYEQMPCEEPITDCGPDSVLCYGELGPVCIERSVLCGCQDQYCNCTDNVQVVYRLDVENCESPPCPLNLGPFC